MKLLQLTSNYRNPKAPTQMEVQYLPFDVYHQWRIRQHVQVPADGGQEQQPAYRHQQSPIPRHHDDHQVHQHPSGESRPEHDGREVASSPVLSSPGEPLLAHAEVLGDDEDGEGESTHQGLAETVAHLVGGDPEELFVEVDVRGGVRLEGDVHVAEADEDAQVGGDLLLREGPVAAQDVQGAHMPAGAVECNWNGDRKLVKLVKSVVGVL